MEKCINVKEERRLSGDRLYRIADCFFPYSISIQLGVELCCAAIRVTYLTLLVNLRRVILLARNWRRIV